MEKINSKILKEIYKQKPKDAKKYDTGFMLVIGGSKFYSGAPALSALGAYKTGVDMVYIIAPERAANIIASFQPDLATYDLSGERVEEKHLSTLLSLTQGADESAHTKSAVVVGGGMGRSEKTKKVIGEYLTQVTMPTVIDADAIYSLRGKVKEKIQDKNFIITPHSYEFYILTGRKINQKDQKEKIEIVKEEAKKLDLTILLKGGTDIISDGEKVALNEAGSPYMTVGGTGDILAGIAGSLLARGVEPFKAACGAAFINGTAGKKVGEKLGESLMASDILDEIPNILSNN